MRSSNWYKLKVIIPEAAQEPSINLLYSLRSLFYKGKGVYCPCCKKSFRNFYSSKACGICPKCGSAPRHRLLQLYLTNKTNFFNDQLKVLHFAPEHCFYNQFKNLRNLFYTSADIGSARAMEKIDITNIGYPGNYFDVILSSHVLEHVTEDRQAMSELYRVLKPNGWSIHQVPIDYSRATTFEDPNISKDNQRQQFYGHHDHKRIYGADYKKRLEEAGFNVTVDSYAAEFTSQEIHRLGINKNEKIYHCKKDKV